MRALKIIVLLLAILGVAAIGWYLLDQNSSDQVASSEATKPAADSVKVERPTETSSDASAPAASEAPKPADTPKPADAPAPKTAGLDPAALALLTPDELEEQYNSIHEVERSTFITDFVIAAGENRAIEVARAHFSGPVEGRNYELANAISQVTAAEYDSRMGSYLAGILAFRGDGTPRDLEASMRYLRHEDLKSSSSALYWRGMIFLDPSYKATDQEAGINLLKRAINVGKEDENGVVLAKQKLKELGIE